MCGLGNFKFHSVPISTIQSLFCFCLFTPLNSTLFLYQLYLIPYPSDCPFYFKFHSVPISTQHEEKILILHKTLNSTLFLYQLFTKWLCFAREYFKFHSVPISTPHKISSHPFTSSTASFVHLPANDNIPTLIYHKYFPLCPCTPDHFFPCQPPAIFAPLPVDRIRYKKKLVLSSSFPQNSLSSHFSWRLLKIITESSPLSI